MNKRIFLGKCRNCDQCWHDWVTDDTLTGVESRCLDCGTVVMLRPHAGSESGVLLPDTRSGSGDKRPLDNASASPLPDQGWGAIGELIAYLEDEAAEMDSCVEEWKDEDTKTADSARKWAADFKRWLAALRRIAPLTQSGEDGGEWCQCGNPSQHVTGWHSDVCCDCRKKLAPPSRKERSVSGNAGGMARELAALDSKSPTKQNG